MARGFSYKADTKHEKSLLIGFTVGIVIIILVLLVAAPFALDFFDGPEGAARWFLLGGVSGMSLIIYGAFLFGYFIPILKSGKHWEYVVDEESLTIRTPHRSAGEDLSIPLSKVDTILQKRRSRNSPAGEEDRFNWMLKLEGGKIYKVPEGGGVILRRFIDAIVRNNPNIKWQRIR